jgi:tetratricopeptide (TPR) repeat protein
MRAFAKDGKYREALYACRADVTQYTIWHKSHTEPAIRMGMPKLGSLLEIDIRALGDLVDDLLWCHFKTETMDEFPAVLERLRANINEPEWQRKIVYFHAMHALWPDWDENAGRRELKKLGSLAGDKDPQILQLYLDLFGDELTFSEKQDLIDRIIAVSNSTDRLHYRGSKAVLYLTIGDHRKADAELSEGISQFRAEHNDDDLSEYKRYRLALSLQLLGMLRQDHTLLTEALTLYQALLKNEDRWSTKGRADLLNLVGETYRYKAEWDNARQSYARAVEMHPKPIYRVFLCDCLLQLDRLEEATRTLGEITLEELSVAEQVDYAFALAGVAIESGEREQLRAAKTVLTNVHVPDPYFRQRRDTLLLNVQEALASGASKSIINRTRRLFAEMTRSATSYLILKPSFMGIGVDVGKVLDDLSKPKETKPTSKAR